MVGAGAGGLGRNESTSNRSDRIYWVQKTPSFRDIFGLWAEWDGCSERMMAGCDRRRACGKKARRDVLAVLDAFRSVRPRPGGTNSGSTGSDRIACSTKFSFLFLRSQIVPVEDPAQKQSPKRKAERSAKRHGLLLRRAITPEI
jgi:hypothetical protein